MGDFNLNDSYKYWSIPVLKEELKKRGLKVSGKKADLVERLFDDDHIKEKEAGIITLNVKTLMGSFITIKISKDSTVLDLRKKVAEDRNVDLSKVKLYFLTHNVKPKLGDVVYAPDMFGQTTVGLCLDDDKSLDEQGVMDGAFFNLHLSLR